MALDRLVDEIEARAKAALDEERTRLDAEKTRIVLERDQRVREVAADADRRARDLAERERVRVLAAARLKVKRLGYEAREATTEQQLDLVREELAGFTKDPDYAKLVRRLYRAASDRLGSGVKVRGRAEDARLLKSVAGAGFVDAPLPILGGLVAESADGARRLNLSFDDLLRLREDEVRAALPR